MLEALLITTFLGKALWMWLVFMSIVLVLLALDLGFFHRDQHEIDVKESLWMSAGYITIGLLFGAWVWFSFGAESGMTYLTGFLIEKSLSLDNIFVISLIFVGLNIPRKYQHRVLFWGIMGVIVLRGIMIGLGAALVAEFSWILYIFAAFLIFTGIKLLFIKGDTDHAPDIENNKAILFFKKRFNVTNQIHGQNFFVKLPHSKTGKMAWFATPLFLALLAIEFVDLVFAVDSVPAIFTITTDPYIIYTSNIFAILGLRALYFALAAILHKFSYLKYALALVLIFIGSKVFIADLMGWTKFPPAVSLGVTVALLAGGVIVSLIKNRKTA
jgi:tellurite resistance protein TerC